MLAYRVGLHKQGRVHMKIIIFGATGMVGQGVLRESILDPEVEKILTIGRHKTDQHHEKLRELVHQDFTDFSPIESDLLGYDACFFCLGASSTGMSEASYTRVTYDFTIAAGQILAKLNPGMTFIYVSGVGADSTERGRTMWARVRGKTENAVLRLPLKAAFVFRPAIIQPLHGITSRTQLYRILYAILRPLFPLWKLLFPNYVTTTRQVGRGMLWVAKHGADKPILQPVDMNRFANL